MNDAADIDIDDWSNLANQSFSSGVFSGDSTTADNSTPLFMVDSGLINSNCGFARPIDMSHYRQFTIKMRSTRPTCTEVAYLLFLQGDSGSYGSAAFGETDIIAPASKWQITPFDMAANNESAHLH